MKKEYTSAPDIQSLRKDIAEACERHQVPDPARWLASIMAGQDPRNMDAPIIDLIRKIEYREFDEEGGTPFPDESEWRELVDHVLSSGLYEHARVPIGESHKAAQKLMEFLHKNQKSITAEIKEVPKRKKPKAITEKDIQRVRKIFNDVF